MFSKSSKPSKTIALLGLWHASIIAPTKELTLALVVDSADKQSCSEKGRPLPDADESFEAGELSKDWTDSDDEGSWHATLASVIDTTAAADKRSCSIKGWSPPDADESFEAGQLSEDFSDSSDEEEEIVFTLNLLPPYNRSRVLYTIPEEI